MPSKSKRNIFFFLGKVILIALLIVFVIRCFFIESFSVTSAQMESSLLRGDRVFVNKTAYGIRLPITILSVPFTFDNFLGYKSYSSAIQLPYKRIFAGKAGRNDVVLFNNPNESMKPLDKRNLILSRCVGLPGDTIYCLNSKYAINGKEYISSPDMIESFSFNPAYLDTIKSLLAKLDIPERQANVEDAIFHLSMSKFELYLINQSLGYPDSLLVQQADTLGYHLIIPYEGMKIKLNPENIVLYKQAILSEAGGLTEIEGGQLKIGGIKQEDYVFTDNYYWMLSDNTTDSVDSRMIGFIPQKSIIGKAFCIWYSNERNVRWKRCFTQVN